MNWLRPGLANTLEHALTRGLDAVATLALVTFLAPEAFSHLAVAQAAVAAALIVFVSPDLVLYRDFATWKAEGARAFAARLRAFRLFAWLKVALAVLIAALFAFVGGGDRAGSFWALLWAFVLAISPQVSGPDREFLRLDLRLGLLILQTAAQKVILVGGTLAAVKYWPGDARYLAWAALGAMAAGALIGWVQTRVVLRDWGPERQGGTVSAVPNAGAFVASSLRDYSLWHHGIGTVYGLVLTLDVLMAKQAGLPERDLGLYATALKFSNLSLAFAVAVASGLSVWLGRRRAGAFSGESREFLVAWGGLSAILLAQAGVFRLVFPLVFAWASRGRWSGIDIAEMLRWSDWMLGAGACLGIGSLGMSWLLVRSRPQTVFFRRVLPWALAAWVVYAFSAFQESSPLQRLAEANLAVGLFYVGMVLLGVASEFRQRPAS